MFFAAAKLAIFYFSSKSFQLYSPPYQSRHLEPDVPNIFSEKSFAMFFLAAKIKIFLKCGIYLPNYLYLCTNISNF